MVHTSAPLLTMRNLPPLRARRDPQFSITSGEYTTSQPKKFCIVAVTRQFPSGACSDGAP
jgi:hypothetical protein